jgi:hypothetical protein
LDTSIVSALSAVLGSVVGGSASIASAWFTQRTQGRRELIRTEIQRKERLYANFISECSKLAIDSLEHTVDNPELFINVYSLQNRIRLTSSPNVVDAGTRAIKLIVERYFGPNLSKDELRALTLSMREEDDPLKLFSEACRRELAELQYSV